MKQPLIILALCIATVVAVYFADPGRGTMAADASAATAEAPHAVDDAQVAALVLGRCGGCHTLQKLVQHPRDRAGWQQSVEDMIRRGAHVSPDEEPLIVDYLARHFGQ